MTTEHDDLISRGGRVRNASGGQTEIRWPTDLSSRHPDDPHVVVERARRVEVLAQIEHKIRPHRRRASPKPNHTRARTAFETAGLEGLAGYRYEGKRAPHMVVRIFYLSEGGEILACETDPMGLGGCDRVRALAPSDAIWMEAVAIFERPADYAPPTEVAIPLEARRAIARQRLGRDASDSAIYSEARRTPERARFVVFPSQIR